MSSDAQVFASAAAIQHQAQCAGLRWLEGKLCNYRPEIYEEVRKAYLRGFKVRKKCVLFPSLGWWIRSLSNGLWSC